MQKTLNCLSEWMVQNNFLFSSDNCRKMVFTGCMSRINYAYTMADIPLARLQWYMLSPINCRIIHRSLQCSQSFYVFCNNELLVKFHYNKNMHCIWEVLNARRYRYIHCCFIRQELLVSCFLCDFVYFVRYTKYLVLL